jgi:putative inorganic carbon (hco3(-)) transporter
MFPEKSIPAKPGGSPVQWMKRFNYFIPLALVLGALVGVAVVYINRPNLVLMAVGIMVGFFLSLYSLEFGLLFLVFISYTRFSEILMEFQGFPSIAKPFLVVMVVLILVRWAVVGDRPKGVTIPALIFGTLWIVGLISILYSPVPDRVWVRLLDDAKNIVIALVVVILLQRGPAFRRVLWILIGIGFFLGTLSVYQYFTKTFDNDYGGFAINQQEQIIGTIDDYRSTGPIGDPNIFAQIMVVLVPISFERFLHEKNKGLRLAALWAFAVSVLTILLTYSRGGFVALAVSMLVLFLYYPPRRFQIPILILSVVVFIAVLPPNYINRLSTLTMFFQPRLTNGINEVSLQGRLSENLTAWEMVKSHPLFGVGLSSYRYLFPFYSKSLGIALVATERDAHNLYLEVLAETGVIGFLVFSVLLFVSFRTVFRARRIFLQANMNNYAGMVTGFLAGLTGYFVAGLFIHNAFPRFFYLLLGLALSLRLVAQNTSAELAGEE